MRAFLSSPRRRRRLGWTLAIVLPLAAVVFTGLRWSDTGRKVVDTPIRTDTTEAAAARPSIAVTPAVRREVDRTVQTFVHTAVIRRDLDAAWPLASPVMRQGVTRRDWERGDIPVQPFPAKALAGAGWRLRYRFERTLGIDVMVQPKEGSGAPVAVYAAELSAPGSGSARRFLVDSWVYQTALGAASGPPEQGSRTEAAGEPDLFYDEGRLGTEWFLLPAGIVLLLLAALGFVAVRSVVRARRAERHYRQSFRR
jgi:hypothetical protein